MTPDGYGPVNEKALQRRVKDHVIGSRHDFFAVVHPGFEETAASELRGLGIGAIQPALTGGLAFTAKLNDAYRVNLGCGTVSRLLLRLTRFKATEFGEFNGKMAAFPWELYLPDQSAIQFTVSAGHSRLWHSGRLEEESLTAIRSRLASFGRKVFSAAKEIATTVERKQTVFIRLDHDRCLVSLDSSGDLLYRRGYDKFSVEAPLRETLACAILKTAAIEKYRVLLDPFCGSGTFGLEAGLIFTGRPANQDRTFAFASWPAFRPAAFAHLKGELADELKNKTKASEKKIYCLDIAAKAVRTTSRNADVMGLAALLEVRHGDFFKLPRPAGEPASMLLVLNPPYGARLGSPEETIRLYRRIGAKIRDDFTGCGVAIIVPGLELEKVLSLPYDQKILFRNGGIPVSLLIKHSGH